MFHVKVPVNIRSVDPKAPSGTFITSFDEEYGMAGPGEVGGNNSTSRSGAHDYVVVLVHSTDRWGGERANAGKKDGEKPLHRETCKMERSVGTTRSVLEGDGASITVQRQVFSGSNTLWCLANHAS